MKIKHTLGPWIPTQLSENRWQITANSPHVSGLTQTVCELDGPWKKENYEANARLIAAAPELLEALEQCCDTIHRLAKESPDGVPMWASDAHDSARLAISKAKGKA